jgi:chromosome segregation and condensation protein ScpB
MENRELARILGSLCFEERLKIIGNLISSGDEGLTMHELSKITGLAPKIVYLHLDYMTETSAVKSRPTATGNIFTANLQLLEKVFTFMNEYYGAGVRLANRAARKKAYLSESLTNDN